MKCPFFIFLLLITINNQLICQNDTINLRDNNGLPHGYWEKYKDDRLFYQVHFDHGIPIGEFTYYYPEKILKASSYTVITAKKLMLFIIIKMVKNMPKGFIIIKKKKANGYITMDMII